MKTGGVRKAKTPRPDRHGKVGRAKVAKRSALDRARRSGARAAVVDKASAAEIQAREQARLDAIASLLWAVFAKSCRLLGVDPEKAAAGGHLSGPEPSTLAWGLYVLTIRELPGLRTEDYAKHRTPTGCLVKQLRQASSWTKVFYLAKRTREWLSSAPKSPMVGTARDALGILVAHATAEADKILARFGPRLDAAGRVVRYQKTVAKAAKRAKALGEAHGKRKARKEAAKAKANRTAAQATAAGPPPPPPPNPEQLALAVPPLAATSPAEEAA